MQSSFAHISPPSCPYCSAAIHSTRTGRSTPILAASIFSPSKLLVTNKIARPLSACDLENRPVRHCHPQRLLRRVLTFDTNSGGSCSSSDFRTNSLADSSIATVEGRGAHGQEAIFDLYIQWSYLRHGCRHPTCCAGHRGKSASVHSFVRPWANNVILGSCRRSSSSRQLGCSRDVCRRRRLQLAARIPRYATTDKDRTSQWPLLKVGISHGLQQIQRGACI